MARPIDWLAEGPLRMRAGGGFGSDPAVPSPRDLPGFHRAVRDIGQSTSFCPTAGCKRLLTKPHFVPRCAWVGSVCKISRHLAETLATAGFQRESGLFMDGQLSLAERAPGTCSQSITLLLKPALMLGLGCMSPLSRALKSAGCSQTLTMR